MRNENSVSPDQVKGGAREAWNAAAQGWNDQTPQIHDWLAEATETMLDLAKVSSGSRILDVAAGAGDQSLVAARRAGPTGYVLATDISEKILEFAAANAATSGLSNIDTLVMDAEQLDVPPNSFDAVICRLGLMLSTEPLKCLQGMHQALKSGGSACVVVFSVPEKNPCIRILLQTAFKRAGLPPADPFQPGSLFSLSKPGHLHGLFAEAGFTDITTTVLSATFKLPTAASYLSFVRSSATPIIRVLSALDESARQSAWAEMESRLAEFQTPEGWMGPNELLLVAAQSSTQK